jgi:hypothetical protein
MHRASASSTEPQRHWVRLAAPFLTVSAGYLAIRLWSFWHEFGATPTLFPDSLVYERSAAIPVTSASFWTSWEPWGLPLFYKLLPGPTSNSGPIAQWVISIASWLVLAWVVSTLVHRQWLRVAGFVIILACSLTSSVGQWDGALLTESLTFSEAALLIAALLVVVRSPNRRNAALVLLAALAFSATRDASVVLAAVLLLPIAAVLWFRRQALVALALAIGVVAIGAMVLVTSGVKRWEILLRDTIAIRVVPNPQMTAYFAARGMPSIGPELPALLYTLDDPPSPFDQPVLAPLHSWLLHSGKTTFGGYLVSNPGFSIVDPVRDLGTMIGPTSASGAFVVAPNDSLAAGMRFYRQPGYRPALPGALESLMNLARGWVAFAWMLIALAVLGLLAWLRVARIFWLVPALCIVATIPYGIVVWDVTPVEIGRHALLTGVLGRLALWLAVLFVVDAYLSARKPTTAATSGVPARRGGAG